MSSSDENDVHTAVAKLGGKTVLERERGASQLNKLLQDPARWPEFKESVASTQDWLVSSAWEDRLGALSARTIAAEHLKDATLAGQAVRDALGLMADEEVRVRFAAGDCLGAAASIPGVQVWETASAPILASIDSCWDRDALVEEEEEPEQGDRGAPPETYVSGLLQSSYHGHKPGSGELRHGTEGWQALETSFVALRRIVEASGERFRHHNSPELRGLLFRACHHPNRFVRETTYHILASLCSLAAGPDLRAFGNDLAAVLQDGLSENWSQVRYAACVCARSFMLAAEGFQQDYFPAILPHLCFNRYDVAEGVRYYSLDTWKLVLRDQGPRQVAQHIDQVVSYYVRCAKTNNHTVREAACTCIAELFVKIDAQAVEPHLPKIQRTLLRTLKDDSWTVRDAASTAYAKAVLAFPEACKPVALTDIWPLWLGMLDENVYSVRQHAAAALADVVRAYGQEVLQQLLPIIRAMLLKAKEQPAETEESPFSSSAPDEAREPAGDGLPSATETTGAENGRAPGFTPQSSAPLENPSAAGSTPVAVPPSITPLKGLVAPLRTSQPAVDTSNRQAVVSLSPGDGPASPRRRPQSMPDRLRSPRSPRTRQPEEQEELFRERSLLKAKAKDTGGIDYSCGCMDYGFRRERQPWEAADGAVNFVAELAGVDPKAALELLPLVADVALLDHWPQARALQTTICQLLPEILCRVGKQAFKPYIELFLEPLFRCLACENQLCRAAAGRCLGSFRDELGPRIFAGRLTEQQQATMAGSPDVPPLSGAFAGVSRFPTSGQSGWPPQAPLRA